MMVFIIITLRDIITRIESVDVPYIITSTIIIGSRTNITQYKSIMFNIVGWWRCGSSDVGRELWFLVESNIECIILIYEMLLCFESLLNCFILFSSGYEDFGIKVNDIFWYSSLKP